MAITVAIAQRGDDSAEELSLVLDAPRIVIGRGRGCEIELPEPSVSLRHASIRREGGRTLLIDEGSTNGTLVGRVKLPPHTPRAIVDGELIRIGRVWLRVQLSATMASDGGAKSLVAREMLRRQLAEGGEATTATLQVLSAEGVEREIELAEPERQYLIGRARQSDLVLEDELASRHHVEVSSDGAGWQVRDLHSKRGSALDGEPLDERGRRWLPGQCLQIGTTEVMLCDPLASAMDEARAASDVAMRPDELAEAPPAQGPELEVEPISIVEAPPEAPLDAAALEELEELEEMALETHPWTEPTRATSAVAASVDLAVVLVALGLMGVSAAGLVYVLG